MSIDGDIKGDVETTKNVDLNGKVIGNISCNNAMMHTAQVQGNVRMKGNVSMKRDTLLMGDLMSTYAEVNGKVRGNLDVVGKADLRGDAVVFGDISASTITVEDGAIIQGYVSTTFLNKEESRNLFPDTIVIEENGVTRA
jgi:cytoskeletal protein CcmA (bactofilin family)